MTGIRFRPIAFMALLLIGLSAYAGGAEEKKTPSTFFESPFVDPEMEFYIEKIAVGPTFVDVPIPKGCEFKLIAYDEGKPEVLMINIFRKGKPLFAIVFNIDNLEKDNGTLFNGVREYVHGVFLAGKLGEDAARYITSDELRPIKTFPSTFEFNTERGYYFRTKMICQIEKIKDKNYVTNLSDYAIYINGYFFTFITVDHHSDETFSKTLASSWFKKLLASNN